MNHLRYVGLPEQEQRAIFSEIVLQNALLIDAFSRVQDLAAQAVDGPETVEFWIVSGALYNSVWNHLTERPLLHGIKDVDLFYFDARDLSWEAEGRLIELGKAVFSDFPLPVEIRNQARVHLWFEQRFGQPYEPLRSATESIGRFSTIAHCVGARSESDGTLTLHAPFGLDDIFSFRLRPNRAIDNAATHRAKARRALSYWPELTFQDWDAAE
ncbi:nucleotidyltransferase family protein [Ochrobactrum teleogrylli]|uniref:Nucleotidyltransferase family protein n=1 Tax=Ochrobactrum teleogrylli TaxID=2479765 RepID=A0ABY2XZQ1_9HYPH|nr:nucleotidyltransferase family protein [[Ochrobactrum] teleogrylli]TNV11155.1 nucleotidyltransferase family protein [[Ochrobactrum] teleogrylli]